MTNSTDYRPGHFENDYRTPLGQELWGWLQGPFNLYRMETASFLERPVVEVLAPHLIDKFGDAIKQDRVKQMTGSMVRQIMESRGYQLDRQHVPIPTKRRLVFSSGSRYKKKGETNAVGMRRERNGN
ncbi:MAG: hypothetical protein ABI843_11695 [Dokdonella sp.]